MIISIDEHVNKMKVYCRIIFVYIVFLSVASFSAVLAADDVDLKEKKHIEYSKKSSRN